MLEFTNTANHKARKEYVCDLCGAKMDLEE